MHCLWCNQPIIPEISWGTLLFLTKPRHLCEPCANKLELLSGNRCERCSRMCDDTICADCVRWEEQTMEHDSLDSNYSVYVYNETIQEIVTKWKYRGDYCLGYMFESHFHQSYQHHFDFLPNDTITVPIPLSAERVADRRFNQAKMLAGFIPLPSQAIISRVDGEKQSKKTRKERLHTKNPFRLIKKVHNPVLLVDDIYTTGTTLRHAAKLLKDNGCPRVYAYTLIRG